jgi:hypothetical protein
MDALGLTLLPPLLVPELAPPLELGLALPVEVWPPPPPRPLPREEPCCCQLGCAALGCPALALAPVNPLDLPPEVSRMRCHLLRICEGRVVLTRITAKDPNFRNFPNLYPNPKQV